MARRRSTGGRGKGRTTISKTFSPTFGLKNAPAAGKKRSGGKSRY